MYIADLPSTPAFPGPPVRDEISPTWTGGPGEGHPEWWAPGTSPTPLGAPSCGSDWCPPERASIPCARICACRMSPGRGAPVRYHRGEISRIYKRHGRTRKVHNLILLPLSGGGGRALRPAGGHRQHPLRRTAHSGAGQSGPAELTLDTCPDAEFIPAHIWTPHFALFGAFSGLIPWRSASGSDRPHPRGGDGPLSDPPMNWRVSALDGLTPGLPL